MDELNEQILAALATADNLEGLARVIRLALLRLADTSGHPDVNALSRLAADLVESAEAHKMHIYGMTGNTRVTVQTERDHESSLIH